MPYINLQSILNKLIWDNRFNIKDYSLTFIHRGAKEDKKTISCRLITKVGKSWFIYKTSQIRLETEIFIPFHRILEIKKSKTGEILWKKKG